MAETEMDETVIKRTQETLGKFVKKPPLTAKLLKKPPFRFLHDVFKAVIKDTGYFEGLYTADELNFENIKDRDDKMRFLQKMIDVVKLTTENDLNVRTSKIVAGHEAERTNELLQLMGEIIEKEMGWQKAVRTVTGAEVGVGGGAGAGTAAAIVNGTIKKENNKNVKTKEKEKTKEKPREKEKASGKIVKEIKSKEGQSKKSTPSPEDKIVKRAIKAVAKEKVPSRQATVEKISKEKDKEKEKVTKKSTDPKDVPPAASKTKDERKGTTPSPVKPVTKATQKQNVNKENIKISKPENESLKVENDVQENEKLLKQQSIENSIATQKLVDLESRTKDIQLENGVTLEKESSASTENLQRKSASSGKSRRSSASKQKSLEIIATTENEQPNLMESLKSLKAVNEEEIKNVPEPQNMQQTMQPPQMIQSTKEIKREPTFTHENSRDSVGSNSNSSNTRPRTSLRPPSARPPSARPGAPRRRDRNVEIILQPNDQVKMSNINVKLETFGDLDDDGENLVIIEDATSSADNLLNESNDTSKLEADKLEQQGHLVQQILETQKELVQQNGNIGLKSEKDMLEPGFDANTRQSSARQMNNLRDIIQSLTKSVNPFGKLMDFIPEDIDAMQLELNMWRDNYTQAASDLKREKSLTESATEPMKNQLIQIDANIKEYLEMIDASRIKILQNSDKISKMLLEHIS